MLTLSATSCFSPPAVFRYFNEWFPRLGSSGRGSGNEKGFMDSYFFIDPTFLAGHPESALGRLTQLRCLPRWKYIAASTSDRV